MEKLQLSAEPLCLEQSWDSDGVDVLHAALTLPQAEGTGRRARRFDRYYRQLGRAYLRYCALELLPQAEAKLRAAQEVSAPFSPAEAALRYTVTYEGEEYLSLYTDARESGLTPRLTIRRAETWARREGLPVPLSEFFPRRCPWRARLLERAREQIEAQLAAGVAAYYPDWRRALRRSFCSRNFYLTGEGLAIFYPMYTVAPAAEGIVTYFLPYGEVEGFII